MELHTCTLYCQLARSFMYVMFGTRPDISLPISFLSLHMSGVDHTHWKSVKHLLRYFQFKNGYTLSLGKFSQGHYISLCSYFDADWAQENNDRRSTSGFIFPLNGSPVSRQTRKLTTVALSTLESEYMSLAAAAKEATWLRRLLP